MDLDGDGGRREFGLRGQRRGTESIVAEMVERRERMGVTAWFCSRREQPEARTHQKTARNNAFEQRTGLIRVGGKFTGQPTATCGADAQASPGRPNDPAFPGLVRACRLPAPPEPLDLKIR